MAFAGSEMLNVASQAMRGPTVSVDVAKTLLLHTVVFASDDAVKRRWRSGKLVG
jgi:hypothetical protein